MINRSLWGRDPFADLDRIADQMDRAFDGFLRPANQVVGGAVPIDIYEQDNKLFICASVPGVKPDDIDVTVEDRVLTIRGESKQNWESNEQTKVYRREQRFGTFTRSIRLPEGLDYENVDAEFENGMVTVSIPKTVKANPEPKRIPVRASAGNRGPCRRFRSPDPAVQPSRKSDVVLAVTAARPITPATPAPP